MSTPTFTIPNRPLTWLITGCSSGIGLALVREVLARGHRVVATSRRPERTPELVAEVERAGGRWLALDVDDPDCGTVIKNLKEENGESIEIDVLINNAGFAILQLIEHAAEAELRAQMETLVYGPLRLIQAVLPGMRRRRFGVIVYISSAAGLEARPSMGMYGASKAAGDALMKTLAREVAPFNVRALYVSLGGFRTNMPTAVQHGATPLDADYVGTPADQTMHALGHSQQLVAGDPSKAARAIVDVAAAQGEIGSAAAAQGQVMLPLGRDALQRAADVRDKLDRAIQVFGKVDVDWQDVVE